MKNANYYTMMEEELKKISDSGSKKKLLLHCCCAPCSSHCLEVLANYFDITAYFYNPNITSDEEYGKRWNGFLKWQKEWKKSRNAGYGVMPVINFVWIKVPRLQKNMDMTISPQPCRSVHIKMQTGSMKSEKSWVSSMV